MAGMHAAQRHAVKHNIPVTAGLHATKPAVLAQRVSKGLGDTVLAIPGERVQPKHGPVSIEALQVLSSAVQDGLLSEGVHVVWGVQSSQCPGSGVHKGLCEAF